MSQHLDADESGASGDYREAAPSAASGTENQLVGGGLRARRLMRMRLQQVQRSGIRDRRRVARRMDEHPDRREPRP
jgi:hypothetical protein